MFPIMSARHLGTLQTLLPFLAILIMIRNSVASALSPDPVQVISSGASKVVMDGDFLITAHIDVTVWDNTVDVGAKIKEFTSGYDMPIVAMSALQGFLYTVASNGPKSIRKWNYTTGSLLWSSPASGDSHRVMVTDLLVNGTSVFYTSYSDGTIKRWDVLTGAFQATVHEMRDMDISKFSVPIHKMYFGSDATKLFASVGRYGPGNNDLPMWRSDFEGNVDLDSGSAGWTRESNFQSQIYIGNSSIAVSGTKVLFAFPNATVRVLTMRTTQVFQAGSIYRSTFWQAALPSIPPSKISVTACDQPLGSLPLADTTTFHQVFSIAFRASAYICNVVMTIESMNSGRSGIAIDWEGFELVRHHENAENMAVPDTRIPLLQDGDFASYNAFQFSASFYAWKRTADQGVVSFASNSEIGGFNYNRNYMWMRTTATSDTAVMQNITLTPGTTYVLRWLAAMRLGPNSNPAAPITSPFNVSACGMVVAGNVVEPSFHFKQTYSAPFSINGTLPMQCELGFTILRGNSTLCDLLITGVELVFVRNQNLVPSGSFEALTNTTGAWEVYPGILGEWLSNGHSTGRAAVARVPGSTCENIRSGPGWYVLWMQSSTELPSTAISVPLTTLVPGATYVVRWRFARRKLFGIALEPPSLSIYFFGTQVASGRIPMSDEFATAQSSEIVAFVAGTMLTLSLSVETIVKHILIDDVEVVMVRQEPEAGSNLYTPVLDGSFENRGGLSYSDTYKQFTSGSIGRTWFVNALSGFLAVVKTPSPTILEDQQTFGHLAIWMKSGSSDISLQQGISISATTASQKYRLRWHQAMRTGGGRLPLLHFRVSACGKVIWQTPATTAFYSLATSELFSINSTGSSCYFEFLVPAHTDYADRNIIIDNVELSRVIGPLVREFSITSSTPATFVRDYVHPDSWMTSLAAGAVVNITSMMIHGDRLYTGMSLSTSGSTCHVLEHDIANGSYVGARSMDCDGGSVRSMAIDSGILYASHKRGIVHSNITNHASTRTLEWSLGPATIGLINEVVANSAYIVASGDNQSAYKWLVNNNKPTSTPNPPNLGNNSPSLTTVQLALIAVGSSAVVFLILGAYLYVRRVQLAKRRRGDYEISKSRENLRRSDMELGRVEVALSHTSLGEIKSSVVVQNDGSVDASRGVPQTNVAQGFTGVLYAQNIPARPTPVAKSFMKVTTPILPQNHRAAPPLSSGGQVFYQQDERIPQALATQRTASPQHMSTRGSLQPGQQATLLSQVVSNYHKRRSLEPTLREQTRLSMKSSLRMDRTNVSHRTLVDDTEQALEIPGFLQLVHGLDYNLGQAFATGGGGQLFHGRMLAPILHDMNVVVKKIINVNLLAFRQEVALMWLFNDNDNMVKLIGFDEANLAIVMPEYTMGSLQHFISAFNYGTKITLSLALDIATGLAAMHDRGIVHQDIKADNVLLVEHPTKRVHAVITDFGISNVVEDKVLKVKAFQVKNVRGLTVKYAAPEAIHRFRSKDRIPVTPRVAKAGDVYSLAMVIHTLLVNKGRVDSDVK